MLRRDFLKLLSTIALYSPLASANKKNLKKITVVGAGIVGTCIAHELSRLGQNVTIIDKSLPGSGTSGKSFNWVNATYPKRPYSYNYFKKIFSLHRRHHTCLSRRFTVVHENVFL